PGTVAPHHRPLGREVQRYHVDVLATHVMPDVQFGPVRQREHAHALALAHARVVEVPQLRALAARVPAVRRVAEREHALLRTRLLLVAARAADRRVVAASLERLLERQRLHHLGVDAGTMAERTDAVAHAVGIDVHAQLDARLGGAAIAEGDHL